jgi:DNA-binding response OmpR family regulator
VEDHGDTAVVMRRLLMARGYAVETAGDVATALKLAEQGSFDLLLSDLGLPDGSGLDLMKSLRERGHIYPAIALSGYGQDQDVKHSLADISKSQTLLGYHPSVPVNEGLRKTFAWYKAERTMAG